MQGRGAGDAEGAEGSGGGGALHGEKGKEGSEVGVHGRNVGSPLGDPWLVWGGWGAAWGGAGLDFDVEHIWGRLKRRCGCGYG